jgi:hypothetical protein
MILDTRRIYFRYDHTEGLRGGTWRTSYHVAPSHIIPSRKAPQELAWRNSRFVDDIISRSQVEGGGGAEIELVDNSSDSESSDNEEKVEIPVEDSDEENAEIPVEDDSPEDSSDESPRRPAASDESPRRPAASDATPSRPAARKSRVPRQIDGDATPRILSRESRFQKQLTKDRLQYARSLPPSQLFPMHSVAPESEISDDDVWQLTNRLRWVDRDEIERSPEYIANILDRDECSTFHSGGLRLAMKLEPIFAVNPAFATLSSAEKKDLLFHIVGKGLHFYTFVLQCPDVAMYLFENKWQPLYTWTLNRATGVNAE